MEFEDNSDRNSRVHRNLSSMDASWIYPSLQWKYAMRRAMQEIAPGVFLGPYSLAQKSKLDKLKKHGITHIICIRQVLEARYIKPNFPEVFQYLTLNIVDDPQENIKQYFETTKAFIDESLAQGGKVLIHGNTGQSRSAVVAVAYVMRRFGLTMAEALRVVESKRFCICPNPGFLAQLEDYEAEISLLRDDNLEGGPRKRMRL